LIIAACMLIMLALTVDEVVAVCQYLSRVHKEKKPFWRTFFMGSEYLDDSVDTRTPSFHESVRRNFKGMTWGVTIPWNLVLTALIGAWLLFANRYLGFKGILADITDVCGALLIVFSIISWAEVMRSLRLVNIIIAIGFALAASLLPGATSETIIHGISVGVIVTILSLFRGKIKEKYGSWDRHIF
jgi:hypothetical protein